MGHSRRPKKLVIANLTWQPYLIYSSFRVNASYETIIEILGDALEELSRQVSNFIDSYQGCLLPDETGKIIAFEDIFNNSNYYHTIDVFFDAALLDSLGIDFDYDGILEGGILK